MRGLGLLLGIELGDPETEGSVGRSRARAAHGAGGRVALAALRRGVIVLPAGDDGHVVELTPAVTLTDEQVDHAVDVVATAVREVF